MLIKESKKVSSTKVKEMLLDESISKSFKMKELFHQGNSIKEISNMLNVRYNFVYNVISNYIVTNSIEIIKEEKVSKKDLVVELFNQGKSLKEISIELKTNYNYVHKIIKEFKQLNEETK